MPEREGRFFFYSIVGDDVLALHTLAENRRTRSNVGSVMKLLIAFADERRIGIGTCNRLAHTEISVRKGWDEKFY